MTAVASGARLPTQPLTTRPAPADIKLDPTTDASFPAAHGFEPSGEPYTLPANPAGHATGAASHLQKLSTEE